MLKKVGTFIDSLREFLSYKMINKHEFTLKEKSNNIKLGIVNEFEVGAATDIKHRADFRNIDFPHEKEMNLSMENSVRNIKKMFNVDPIQDLIRKNREGQTENNFMNRHSINKL